MSRSGWTEGQREAFRSLAGAGWHTTGDLAVRAGTSPSSMGQTLGALYSRRFVDRFDPGAQQSHQWTALAPCACSHAVSVHTMRRCRYCRERCRGYLPAWVERLAPPSELEVRW